MQLENAAFGCAIKSVQQSIVTIMRCDAFIVQVVVGGGGHLRYSV